MFGEGEGDEQSRRRGSMGDGAWRGRCEHAAAIIYQLADICDDDPFFVYQMRGLHLAAQLRACRGIKHPRVEVNLREPCGTSSQPVGCRSGCVGYTG